MILMRIEVLMCAFFSANPKICIGEAKKSQKQTNKICKMEQICLTSSYYSSYTQVFSIQSMIPSPGFHSAQLFPSLFEY